jgi:hypothetical protein
LPTFIDSGKQRTADEFDIKEGRAKDYIFTKKCIIMIYDDVRPICFVLTNESNFMLQAELLTLHLSHNLQYLSIT